MSKHDDDFSTCAGASRDLMESAQQAAQKWCSLNALAYVDWQAALQLAQASDDDAAQKRSRGLALGPMHGVPVTVKDLYQVDGMPTRAGTRASLPELSGVQALAVSRMQAAGAVVFAKTNMHEIALGATGENAWTGDVCNPYSAAHQAGGSSSGAAVAVASGIGLIGLGSDTGGSVRIPAAFCGIVGFKPSFGRIPLDGALPLSWTCDHAGPLARRVGQARIAYEVMAGAVPTAYSEIAPRALKIGLLPSWEAPRLAQDLAADFAHVQAKMRDLGMQLISLAPDASLKTAWEVYSTIVRAEAAWVHRKVLADDRAAQEGFSAGVLAPLRAGRGLNAQDYLDAMQRRARARLEINSALEEVDVIITPTSAVYPPLRGQETVNLALGRAMSVREAVLGQTMPFSLYGLPTLSLPWHQTIAARGFPLGLQIIGKPGADSQVLDISQTLETLLG
jgi:aspartyl-tRNA(Asn)/glutamyl-tRNA(Gln) amidotransferase subunit A